MTDKLTTGERIQCARCGGHGIVSTWSFGVKEPDECKDCGGSGANWQYPKGAIAMFYGGPFIGRASPTEERSND